MGVSNNSMCRETALVTGAAGGIGREIAQELAARGCDIIAVDQSQEGLASLSKDIESRHQDRTVTLLTLDLARPEAAEELFNLCVERGIVVDILVNNVGFGKMGEHIEQSPDVIRNMVTLNNTLLMELCLRFGKQMKERRSGKILNVASLVGFSASPYFAAYSGTKASTLAFSTAFAQEMSDYNVTVSCLCPGTTETQFLNVAASNTEAARGMRRFASAFIADPKTVAKAGIEGLLKEKIVNVPTAFLKAQAIILDALPAPFVSGFVKRSIKKGNKRESAAASTAEEAV